jgi:hypothetical protein
MSSGWSAPEAATPLSAPRSATAPSPAGSLSAAAGCGLTVRGARRRRHERDVAADLGGIRDHRAAGPADAGADAGQAVDPPLPGGRAPVGSPVEQISSGTSKPAVSRRFVAATEPAWPNCSLGICLGSIWWPSDRRHPGGRALLGGGVGDRPGRHEVPLAVAEGATEHAPVARDLLADLRERGLDTTRPLLGVIDGARPCPGRCWRCSTTR